MRRLTVSLFMLGCVPWLLLGAPAALADNGPHVAGMGATTEKCAACHRAHTAQAPYLLKESSEEALCYTCHGSSGTGSNLDVADGVGYSGAERSGGAAGALRGGGFKYALIDSSKPVGNYEATSPYRLISGEIPALSEGAAVNSAHTVNSSSQMAWGNGAIAAEANYGKTLSLRCGSCHDPHGNGDYRILRPIPQESGGTEVKIADAETKEYRTTNYWQSWETNNKQFRYLISSWCATCHTRLLAESKSGDISSGDAVFTYRHRSFFTQAEYEALEASSATKTKPSCIQCHVAHGSDAKMEGYATTINYPNGTAAGSDSFLLRVDNRGTCQMCHKK
jgi:predicted CXXCH cytochrome family protein